MGKLIELLRPVYGSNLEPVLLYDDPFGNQFRPVVLMSLATAALHLDKRYIKRELNVCRPKDIGLRAGRVDGVSAVSLNGHEGLDEEDLDVVMSVSGMAHQTLGPLVCDTHNISGGRVGLLAEDLKFEVGDILKREINGHPLSDAVRLTRPLASHRHQGDRYIALGSVDAVSTWSRGQKLDPRLIGVRFSYIGPNGINEFVITPDDERVEEVIGDELASNWPEVVEYARIRAIENNVLGHIINLGRMVDVPQVFPKKILLVKTVRLKQLCL